MARMTRRWIYGKPIEDDRVGPEQFELREVPLPDLKEGEALVRVKLINIHANTRMHLATRYTPLGETEMGNYACAEVIESRTPTLKRGDIIACQTGWQEYQVIQPEANAVGHGTASELIKALNGTNSPWTYTFRPAIVEMWPMEVLMEMFGTSGMTAYFGMRECGPLTPSDRVAVAAATGSVGSIAAQLAKAAGCYVVGFAGGKDRCAWAIENLGVDHCIDYRASDLKEQLKDVFPDGIDVYSDGVGGSLTKTVVERLKHNGRLFSYGAAAAFYAEQFAPISQPFNMRKFFGISDEVDGLFKTKNIKTEHWMVDAFYHERLKAEDDLSRLLHAVKLKAICNVVVGFENLPQAITDLYLTPRSGKLQVRFEVG